MSDRRLAMLGFVVLGLWVVLVVGSVIFFATRAKRGLPGLPSVPALTGLTGSKSAGGQPLPCGPDAYTDKQYRQLHLDFHRKRGALAYRQFGNHHAAWDSMAADFLEQKAHQWAALEPIPDGDKLLALAQRVAASGCDDPLALTYVGSTLLDSGDTKAAEACFQRAYDGFKNSKYPVYCQTSAIFGLAALKGQLGATIEAPNLVWREQAISTMISAAKAEYFDKGEQRIFWESILQPVMEKDLRRSQAVIINTIKARPETDPWLFRMAWGKHNNDYAWLQRGTGWASSVKPEAMKEFGKAENDAGGNWEKAYALHPEYPEAATELISVANATGNGNPRVWFDRAVAAQFDWRPAYYAMVNALLPRWGGSHQAMLAFAKECLDTERFDTPVPVMYQEIVQTISEKDRDATIWNDPAVWANLQTYYEGELAYVTQHAPETVKELRTIYFISAWRSGHQDIARQQLEAMGGDVDRHTLDAQWGERAELVVGRIYATTGPRAEAMKQAEELFQGQQTDKALAAFEGLLRDETEKHVRFYLRDRIQTLRWEKQLAADQWVDLMPTEDLVGWDIWEGGFTPLPDGKGFAVTSGEKSTLMMNHIRPGEYYEITSDVEFPAERVKGIEAGFVADVAMVADTYYDTCRIVQNPPQGVYGPFLETYRDHALREVPRKFKMQLLVCGGKYTLRMNDETVFQDVGATQRDIRFQGAHNVGIGGEGWTDGKKPVIYRNIRIHKIGTNPIPTGVTR